MTFKRQKVVKALQKKVFEKDKDGKHITLTYRPLDRGLPRISTFVRSRQ